MGPSKGAGTGDGGIQEAVVSVGGRCGAGGVEGAVGQVWARMHVHFMDYGNS
jgi:hypothetical protein